MTVFNIFRVTGDLSHIASKLILLWSIHWNRSSEGVSLITQVLYILVFATRYLDIFSHSIFEKFIYFYLFSVKLFYLLSSAYIVFLMTFAYARTREKEQAWKFGIYCLVAALVLAAPVCKIFEFGPVVNVSEAIDDGREQIKVLMWSHEFTFKEVLWIFSEILESVAVLPQLILLRQTNVPTVIDSYYLVLLGSYRGFYILNWIQRFADAKERHFDPVAVIFGVIQTILYMDFAWVYYSRQRVKLRNGGIVDSEDLERGFFIGRLVGKKNHHDDDNEDEDDHDEQGNSHVRKGGRWGPRGISVSADEESEDTRPLADPQSFEDDLTDDESTPTNQGPIESSPWATSASASASASAPTPTASTTTVKNAQY